MTFLTQVIILTLSLLGTRKPEYAPPPPSKFYVWCPNMRNDTSLESYYALYFYNMQKNANLREFFFLQYPVIYCKNVGKTCPKINKIYIFEKPWSCDYNMPKKCAKS